MNEKVACPSDIGQTVQAIAEVRRSSAQEIKDLVARNLKSLLAEEPI